MARWVQTIHPDLEDHHTRQSHPAPGGHPQSIPRPGTPPNAGTGCAYQLIQPGAGVPGITIPIFSTAPAPNNQQIWYFITTDVAITTDPVTNGSVQIYFEFETLN